MLPDRVHGSADAALGAAIDGDDCAFGGEQAGGGKADPGCRAGDQRTLVFESEVQNQLRSAIVVPRPEF